jgi:hypothetical protein
MEQGYEEATKESARGGAWAAGRIGVQRGQAACEPRKWPQGRPGQKPEETYRIAAQRTASAPRSQQEIIEIVIAAIRARFGPQAIALGNAGIRYARALRVSGGRIGG